MLSAQSLRDTIIPGGCMIMDTATVCERKQLSASDELKPGDTIFTGPDGYVELRVKSLKGHISGQVNP